MQAGYNSILVTIEKEFNDSIKTESGIEFYLDPTWEPEQHATICGTVVSIPSFKRIPGSWDIKIGDKLYFNYMVVLQPENRIDHLWSVDAMLCIARVRAGELKPLGNYILLRPIVETTEKIGKIFLPQQSQRKSLNKGTVVASNLPSAEAGDVVLFNKIGKFENKIEGEILYCAIENNIWCKEKLNDAKTNRKNNRARAGK